MKKTLSGFTATIILLLVIQWLLSGLVFSQARPQEIEKSIRLSDSVKALQLFNRGLAKASENKNDSALYFFEESRSLASGNGFKQTEALASSSIASILVQSAGLWESTLRYLIIAEMRYRELNDSIHTADIYKRMALMYLSVDVFPIAANFFQQEYSMYNRGQKAGKGLSAKMAAEALSLSRNVPGAIEWYDSSRVWYSQLNDNVNLTGITNSLISLLVENGSYDDALELVMSKINTLELAAASHELSTFHNNAGFLKFRKGDYTTALSQFRRAEELSLGDPRDEKSLVDIYTNMAVCYQALDQSDLMISYFKKALNMARDNMLIKEQAHIEMLMAVVYLNRSDLHNAEIYCVACTTSARLSESYETLKICYEKYAEVLESGNDFIAALDLSQKYIALRDSLVFADQRQRQIEDEQRARYERIESRLRVEAADEDVFANTIRRLRADSLSQMYNLELAKSQSEFEKEKNTSLNLSLNLALKTTEAQKERVKTDSLRLENISQENELRQKEADEKLLLKEKDLLESQKKEADLKVEQEEQKRKMAFLIAVLMVLIVIGALYNLISVRKKNQKLAESKKKIEEINSDLEAKNIEIVLQKEIIEQKNQSITDSIQYASRIQNAVLLPVNFLVDWGLDNFVYFRPKDIVSGDFYWGFRKKGRIFIAAADCTGHGVPGGFMSMLGNAFLNEIMITTDLSTASEILDKLRDEIIRALRQKGVIGEARDGMDISLAIVDRNTDYIQYAGANNPLYRIRDGELTRYQADRMPIGIHVTEIAPFTNHKIDVRSGDLIYLFSDGYADQFGGDNGKKFMYKQFQELLASVSGLPMAEQREQLDTAFERWRGKFDQIDDVLVIGFKIR